MHGKNLALTLTLTLLVVGLVPFPSSGHTTTARYDVPSGPSGDLDTAVNTRLCAEEWDDWEEGLLLNDDRDDAVGPPLTAAFTTACTEVRDAWAEDGIKVGTYDLDAGMHDTDGWLTFTAVDDHFDSTYLKVCIEVCDSELTVYPPTTYSGCGALQVPQADDYLVFVYATHRDPDTGEICGGSSGTLTIDH